MTLYLYFILVNYVILHVSCGVPGPDRSICTKVISRTRWGGRIPLEVDYALVPIQYVIVHHTVTGNCNTETECGNILKSVQDFHMDELEFHDIGYNFLVGGDGNVYEGAGWHKVGAHTRGYNTRSMGLAFIGSFSEKLPTEKQMQAAKDFLECSVERGELDANFKLLGARQVSATQSPGLKFYRELTDWKHYSSAV